MTLDQIISFAAFSVIASITPGPSNVLLTATGALVGIWRGMACLFGVLAGMGSLMLLAALGLGSVITAFPALLDAMKWLGAAFLLWLSWKIATAPLAVGNDADRAAGFVTAAAFQWINPKSWLVSTSAVATYLSPDTGNALAQSFVFAMVFVISALPSCFIWLSFGAGMDRLLRSERAARLFNAAMGLALAASVLFILN